MSEDPRRWQIRARTQLVHDRWLQLDSCEMVTPAGEVLSPFYLISESPWVCALPVLPDGQVVVVEQYRVGVDRMTWEFPAGDIDPGERPTDAVLRELREETGYLATGEVHPLPTLFPDPSRNSVTGMGFVVPVAAAAQTQELGEGEAIRVRVLAASAVDAAIADGRLAHAAHVAWWCLAQRLGLIRSG